MKKWIVTISVIALLLAACATNNPISPSHVVIAFEKAGLEVSAPRTMTKDDYGMAPLADEGIRFFIPSLCEKCGGRIMLFKDPDMKKLAIEYYEGLGKRNAAFFSWVFSRENIVLQINGDLPEAEALRYEKALNEAEAVLP